MGARTGFRGKSLGGVLVKLYTTAFVFFAFMKLLGLSKSNNLKNKNNKTSNKKSNQVQPNHNNMKSMLGSFIMFVV